MRVLMLGSASYKSSLTYFRLVAIGRHLAELGDEVTFILPSADKYNDFMPEPKATIAGAKLVQPWQPATKSMMLNLFPYLVTASLSIIRRHCDVVYLYKPTPITIIGFWQKLLFRTPVIVDLDDLGSEVMRLEGQSKLMVTLVAWCERFAVKHATAIVVASTYLENLTRARHPNKPILVLSNGVDPKEYALLPGKQLRPALYYFGALNRLSIIEPLLQTLPKVVNAIPDVAVAILGGGAALDQAKQLCESLGISKNVFFSGWIDKQAIRKYAHFGDIALCSQPDIPTVRAASNLKVFQYMALGNVPVVSDVGDLASYVDARSSAAVGVAVEPDNTDVLAASLIDLLRDEQRRRQMALGARKRVESYYSWELLATRLQSFLLDVVHTKGRNHG